MSRNSIAAAKAELFGLLSGANLPTGVAAAYDYEPLPGQMAKPVAITVFTVGMTSDFYVYELRIYQTAEIDARVAQNNLDDLVMLVDSKITSGFGPSDWRIGLDTEIAAFVAVNTLMAGRED